MTTDAFGTQWARGLAAGACLLVSCLAADALGAPPPADEIVRKFLAAVDQRADLTAEQRAAVRAAVDKARGTPDTERTALVAGLAVVTPGLREALDILESVNGRADESQMRLTATLGKLAADPDPYVAATASELVGKFLALEGRFADALPHLVNVTDKHADRILALEGALLARAQVEASLLRRDESIETYRRLLREFPMLPMRADVQQQLTNLESLEPGSLDDIRDRMRFSTRQLAQADTGEAVRGEQERIVELLDQLIERAQQQEGQGKGKGRKSGQGSGQGAGSGKPGSGAGDGTGKGSGNPSEGPAVRRLTRGGPQSPWGQLRDKERDPAFSAIKEKLPARYQQLIEQYYKSFQEDR